MIWERIHFKGPRVLRNAFKRSSTRSSQSSNDSGYASISTSATYQGEDPALSTTASVHRTPSSAGTPPSQEQQSSALCDASQEGCTSTATAQLLMAVPEEPPANTTTSQQSTASTEEAPRTNAEATELPQALPTDRVLPINPETQRAARKIVTGFRQNFGNRLTRTLTGAATQRKAAAARPHAVAIFPSVAWRKGFVNTQVVVEIIIQCHPSDEDKVRNFLREHRTAIDTFVGFACPQAHEVVINVEFRVVGREVMFLSRTSVYMSGCTPEDSQEMELPARELTIDSGNGNAAHSTLGGLISITPSGPQFCSVWFGMTTAHGLSAPTLWENPRKGSVLQLIFDALRFIDRWSIQRGSTRGITLYSHDLDSTLESCQEVMRQVARTWFRAQNTNPKAEQEYTTRLSNFQSALERARAMPVGLQGYYLARKTHSLLKLLDGTRSDPDKDFLKSSSRGSITTTAGGREMCSQMDMDVEGTQSKNLIGHISLTSRDVFPDAEAANLYTRAGSLDAWTFELGVAEEEKYEGTLDWALLHLIRNESGQSLFTSASSDGAFEPSEPSADMEENPRAILLSQRSGYPEVQICPGAAFLSFPPSAELVEVLTANLKPSEGDASTIAPELSAGVSGSWVVSMDRRGKKVVHGQLVAVNYLGEGLIVPMKRIVAAISAKLSPIFDYTPLKIQAHVPMKALDLADTPQPTGDEANMSEEEKLLAWKFMKTGLLAAMAMWKKAIPQITLRVRDRMEVEAWARWTSEEREWREEIQNLGQLLPTSPLGAIRGGLEKRRQVWNNRESYWERYQVSLSRPLAESKPRHLSSRTLPQPNLSLLSSRTWRRPGSSGNSTTSRTTAGSRSMRSSRNSGGESSSHRSTGSLRSMWSSPSTAETDLTSFDHDEGGPEAFHTIYESENECESSLEDGDGDGDEVKDW